MGTPITPIPGNPYIFKWEKGWADSNELRFDDLLKSGLEGVEASKSLDTSLENIFHGKTGGVVSSTESLVQMNMTEDVKH